MWFGGVRVIIPDNEGRILLVCQHHEGKDIWLPPGGSIDDGESSEEAAVREVLEETGLVVEIKQMIWYVEEVSERGQRFAVYFLAEQISGELALGTDPEFEEDQQVLRELRFMFREEVHKLDHVYPPYIKDEVWEILKEIRNKSNTTYSVYKSR